ncbi:MAG: hypothetical protein KAH22_03575 [Thiotrichaceae bacterium]|nr:hypothetical protein [Thiotrichaceae bacterium]
MNRIIIILLILVVLIFSAFVGYNRYYEQTQIVADTLVPDNEWNSFAAEKSSHRRNLLLSHHPKIQGATGQIIWNERLQQGMLRFLALPTLRNNQVYALWQFNLKSKLNKPILLAKFNHIGNKRAPFDIRFSAKQLDKVLYKFLITIEDNNEKLSLPNQKKSVFISHP